MEKKYFNISEVCEKASISQHTLRYWEKKTGLIRPIRLAAGHRRYTLNDLENIKKIKDLIYLKGYSLKGISRVKRKLQEEGHIINPAQEKHKHKRESSFLKEILKDLKAVEKSLK